jgi:hypothetical protein
MLNSNGTCTVEKVTGFTINGEPKFGSPTREPIAVIRLARMMTRTTVRADSSSSRGHGDEKTAQSKVLLSGETIADLGDRLVVLGAQLRIIEMRPRLDISGYVDHYETDCELWA